MRKTILAMLCMAVAGTTSCAQQKQSKNAGQENKILVAYFSATGNTAKAAKSLQGATNGELYARRTVHRRRPRLERQGIPELSGNERPRITSCH